MKLFVEGKLENLFKPKDFKDATSGEIKKQKWQLEFFERVEGEEGTQTVIHKISIPDEKLELYQKQVGNSVKVEVKSWQTKTKSGFYGV